MQGEANPISNSLRVGIGIFFQSRQTATVMVRATYKSKRPQHEGRVSKASGRQKGRATNGTWVGFVEERNVKERLLEKLGK